MVMLTSVQAHSKRLSSALLLEELEDNRCYHVLGKREEFSLEEGELVLALNSLLYLLKLCIRIVLRQALETDFVVRLQPVFPVTLDHTV